MPWAGWSNLLHTLKVVFSLLISSILLVACSSRPDSLPPEVATQNSSAQSPSGKYELIVVSGNDGAVQFQSFQILNKFGKGVFASTDRFRVRDTTIFLWDTGDRVWVYSGDVGTFVWQRDPNSPDLSDGKCANPNTPSIADCPDYTETWIKASYLESGLPAPAFLKRVRPQYHSQ